MAQQEGEDEHRVTFTANSSAYHDSFHSTSTTMSTSSLDSTDAAPVLPKRRLISFSDEVEVREFEVEEEEEISFPTSPSKRGTGSEKTVTVGGRKSKGVFGRAKAITTSRTNEDLMEIPDSKQRWDTKLNIGTAEGLQPPKRISSLGSDDDEDERHITV